IPWIFLFPCSLAIPALSIRLVPPYPSSQEDPIHVTCMASRDFLGANFTLYQGGQLVQLLQAPPNQCGVMFNLSGSSSEAPGGPFHHQYGVIGEHNQPQLSDLSEPLNISFSVPTWILALSLSLAGALLLLAGLVAVVMSFDNSLFTVSLLDDHSGTTATPSNSRTRKMPTSTSSSPEPPEFSTFWACQ
uniref:C19orf38 Ig domain-containing protein n=1 Tax=Aotus nancymaae TaxID=37293 RepID=A0A2K5CVP2_AOTNA